MTFVRTLGSTSTTNATIPLATSPSPLHSSIYCSTFSNQLNFPLNSIRTTQKFVGLKCLGNQFSPAIEMEHTPNSSAVAEFKGPAIFGVVRFAQLNMEFARIEANFGGLAPGKYGWSINEFGDVTKGAASTGNIFNPTNYEKEPLGDLETLHVDDQGEAFFSGVKGKLIVGDLIGRSIVVYGSEDRSGEGLVAAVIARSAGIGNGDNCKKLCGCDGTAIWEANTNAVSCPRS